MKEITTIYTARFADGTEITKTDRDGIKNRLDMSNWICKNRLGKKHNQEVKEPGGSTLKGTSAAHTEH